MNIDDIILLTLGKILGAGAVSYNDLTEPQKKIVEEAKKQIQELIVEAQLKDRTDDILDGIIMSNLMNLQVYAKVQFDNAKDTTQMLAAASECQKQLVEAVKYRARGYIDELVSERLAALKSTQPKTEVGGE